MEGFRTEGFTAKDLFNAASATPIKSLKGSSIEVTDVMVSVNSDGELVGYMKDTQGIIYATISSTVIDQLKPLAELLDDASSIRIGVISKTSDNDREYFMLELV